ncbi:MAG: ribosomal-protein-alanine N-acetyltransferase [Sphingobium sp.]|jgi:ribosomal-protein-alanine N-acetyltransferase|uniref:ribosomal protein S18-alanine N-acetyltransferase n=1 Tax=Sphingobium sp. TaxID=1912891 RepID=UPI000C49D648|nr:ribosomal protein S18-alanine N-acetyltransferase [Sphingobium sp.]MBU0658644.1 ribosomal protein S18-alanine N-acetyltransferase [Alphaproteobacteria bacterium]MBA4754894.1 ribosomal protein S18-alanine N-acetyltransferase [Sphingobium sp.]MBS87220.1 ribosomal-protein-alanine N-acetyltransferase [Sphingobium sp.]MBU0869020.1 ribosomal protein S18-alanine N-acetyltransferase [Alphaproteobacteria bacterium]MBU1257560.1 ribosomal protein S18-alanine N-acetyltransferase [Alphaproteobacteria ba
MIPGLVLDTYDQSERNAMADAMTVMEAAFDPVFGEAWTLPQLAGVMMMPGTWLTIARVDAAALGFALVRSVLDECELLLLAVDPAWRGRGVGEALLRDSLRTARRRGITSMNLEVRASNNAVYLYEKTGFEYVHRRPGYYRGNDGQLYDALSFRIDMLA